MALLAKKQVIYGCESRGDGNSPYLTRYAFPRIGPVRMCLHIFHRSDADDLHDHPWPFVSVILWRGYWEVTPWRRAYDGPPSDGSPEIRQRKRVWPGMILFRSALHSHRVELVEGKRAITLVFMGRRIREWGFFTRQGWKLWTKYFTENGC
jgi:hypothetical protein